MRKDKMRENARRKICDEILKIMESYHKQEERGDIDTPGGLEHMGDVWKLFRHWEFMLKNGVNKEN